MQLDGLKIFDPEDRKVVETSRITLKKNLFGLIMSWANLNELEIRQPKLWLYADKTGQVSLARAIEMRVVVEDPDAPPAKLPALAGSLKLIDGRAEIINYDDQRQNVSFSGQCDLATLNDIKVSFQASVDDIGELKGQTDITNLAPDGLLDVNKMSVEISAESGSPINLGSAAALVGRKGVGGKATVKFDSKYANGKFEGKFAAAVSKFLSAEKTPEKAKPIDLNLSGEISAGETDASGSINLAAPTAGAMSATFKYEYPSEGKDFDGAKLAEALAKWQMIELPGFTMKSTVDLDIARMAAAAPDLLNIRDDAKLHELTVQVIDATVRGGKQPEVSGKIAIGQARANVAGQEVVCKPTTAVLAIKTAADSTLQIETVDINVGQGLVSVKTSGTATDMTLEAHARLAELKQQMGQIFDLKNLVLTGEMHLSGRIQRPKPAAQDTTRLDVDLEARAEAVEYRADRTVEGSAIALDTQAAWKASLTMAGDDISANGQLKLDPSRSGSSRSARCFARCCPSPSN